jgi:SAM-dependent methyltransferase
LTPVGISINFAEYVVWAQDRQTPRAPIPLRQLIATPKLHPDKFALLPPLPACQPTERFSKRAEDYRRHRPSYPQDVVDLICKTANLKAGSSVADIGSGTGILSNLLLHAGLEVWAVEPNEAMRRAAEEELGALPRFHSVAATAESTHLPNASFAAITVAQAFHWFEPAAARREFQRLLRPGGWAFIIRNDRLADASSFARDYEDLLISLGESYRMVTHRDREGSAISRRAFFQEGETHEAYFDNPQTLDWPKLRGRFLSSSYVPAVGEPRHEASLAELEEIFHRHARKGCVILPQRTEVHFGKLGT